MSTSRVVVWLSILALAACSGGKSGEQARPPATPAKTVADTGATTNPPAELSMDLQHHTMDSVQANYTALMTAVSGKDKGGTSNAAKQIMALADRIPVFMIHKAGVTPDSLRQWARMLKGQAMRVGQLADADSLDAATQVAASMAGTCQTCHDMYRVEEEHGAAEEHEHAPAKATPKKAAKSK